MLLSIPLDTLHAFLWNQLQATGTIVLKDSHMIPNLAVKTLDLVANLPAFTRPAHTSTFTMGNSVLTQVKSCEAPSTGPEEPNRAKTKQGCRISRDTDRDL